MPIQFDFRDMTDAEYQREQVAFDDHGLEFGNPPEKQERFGYVATDGEKFVGCSSGLAQKIADQQYGKYFYLSDLLVEKEYRRQGIGKQLLKLLESQIFRLGIEYIWTWTSEYEGLDFYQKQGYAVFTKFDNFYLSGHARFGMIKQLVEKSRLE